MVVLHVLFPISTVVTPPLSLVGLVPLAAGGVVVVWTRGAFTEARTPIRPLTESTTLLTHGLYRYSRNPMYAGAVLILSGVAILLGTVGPMLVVGLFVLTLRLRFIRLEEQLLETTFGERYRVYRASVRRWV
jgi:protein-S-isoprenylcysteine O-methyltransferase Ste14